MIEYNFRDFLYEEAAKKETYNDEHAHMNVWNHMVNKGITHDHGAMLNELEKAKTDKTHPLHFNNISSDGFKGKKKTEGAKDSYHSELRTAVDTIHALHNHPDFKKAVKEKHQAEVMGGATGQVSDLWKSHGAKNGTSKADLVIKDPKSKTGGGIKLSMKKGAGSQLMSAGPEEAKAVHDAAAREMLDNHPAYKNLSDEEKTTHHHLILHIMDKVNEHVNAMKTASREDMIKHKNEAQKQLDHLHDNFPELNEYVRKEATTGQAKFGKDSPYAASYLVKSSAGKKGAVVKSADEVDYNGPRPRVALPKGDGRSGNIKLDER
jgi:hypothetical protein